MNFFLKLVYHAVLPISRSAFVQFYPSPTNLEFCLSWRKRIKQNVVVEGENASYEKIPVLLPNLINIGAFYFDEFEHSSSLREVIGSQ